MAAKKAATKVAAEKAENVPAKPTTKNVYQVDQGEALPPQAPFPTATDKHK